MWCREGHLVHIDFGFILETSPGGNMRFESANFKLSHEMTQILDPSGGMRSESWQRFVRCCFTPTANNSSLLINLVDGVSNIKTVQYFGLDFSHFAAVVTTAFSL